MTSIPSDSSRAANGPGRSPHARGSGFVATASAHRQATAAHPGATAQFDPSAPRCATLRQSGNTTLCHNTTGAGLSPLRRLTARPGPTPRLDVAAEVSATQSRRTTCGNLAPHAAAQRKPPLPPWTASHRVGATLCLLFTALTTEPSRGTALFARTGFTPLALGRLSEPDGLLKRSAAAPARARDCDEPNYKSRWRRERSGCSANHRGGGLPPFGTHNQAENGVGFGRAFLWKDAGGGDSFFGNWAAGQTDQGM